MSPQQRSSVRLTTDTFEAVTSRFSGRSCRAHSDCGLITCVWDICIERFGAVKTGNEFLVPLEPYDQSEEETWPDQQKDNDNDKDNAKDIWRTVSKSNPRDLWTLRHSLHLWQLRTILAMFIYSTCIWWSATEYGLFCGVCIIIKQTRVHTNSCITVQLLVQFVHWLDYFSRGSPFSICSSLTRSMFWSSQDPLVLLKQ